MAKGDKLYNKALLEASSEPENNYNAFLFLERSANFGNHKAIYALATWYLFGKYVKKDLMKGVDYLKIAAEKGSADACFDLAIAYEKGKGIDKDKELGFKYYLIAALRGHKAAIHEVARCYYYGLGVEKNKSLGENLNKLYNEME